MSKIFIVAAVALGAHALRMDGSGGERSWNHWKLQNLAKILQVDK